MKWYNKDKTECLDLSKIGYWKYWDVKSTEEANEAFLSKFGNMFNDLVGTLKVVVDGYELEFSGTEAEEIYNLIRNNKELL